MRTDVIQIFYLNQLGVIRRVIRKVIFFEDRALIQPALLSQVSSRLVSCQHRHGPQWENFTQAVIFSESQAMSRLHSGEPLLPLTHPTTHFSQNRFTVDTLDLKRFLVSDDFLQYFLAFKIDIQWALNHSWFVQLCSEQWAEFLLMDEINLLTSCQ